MATTVNEGSIAVAVSTNVETDPTAASVIIERAELSLADLDEAVNATWFDEFPGQKRYEKQVVEKLEVALAALPDARCARLEIRKDCWGEFNEAYSTASSTIAAFDGAGYGSTYADVNKDMTLFKEGHVAFSADLVKPTAVQYFGSTPDIKDKAPNTATIVDWLSPQADYPEITTGDELTCTSETGTSFMLEYSSSKVPEYFLRDNANANSNDRNDLHQAVLDRHGGTGLGEGDILLLVIKPLGQTLSGTHNNFSVNYKANPRSNHMYNPNPNLYYVDSVTLNDNFKYLAIKMPYENDDVTRAANRDAAYNAIKTRLYNDGSFVQSLFDNMDKFAESYADYAGFQGVKLADAAAMQAAPLSWSADEASYFSALVALADAMFGPAPSNSGLYSALPEGFRTRFDAISGGVDSVPMFGYRAKLIEILDTMMYDATSPDPNPYSLVTNAANIDGVVDGTPCAAAVAAKQVAGHTAAWLSDSVNNAEYGNIVTSEAGVHAHWATDMSTTSGLWQKSKAYAAASTQADAQYAEAQADLTAKQAVKDAATAEVLAREADKSAQEAIVADQSNSIAARNAAQAQLDILNLGAGDTNHNDYPQSIHKAEADETAAATGVSDSTANLGRKLTSKTDMSSYKTASAAGYETVYATLTGFDADLSQHN